MSSQKFTNNSTTANNSTRIQQQSKGYTSNYKNTSMNYPFTPSL